MKRKKSKHKQAAVAFLTNIPLEGYHGVVKEAKACPMHTTAASNTADPSGCHQQSKLDGFRKTQLCDATNLPTAKSIPFEQNVLCDEGTHTPLDDILHGDSDHWLQLKGRNYENAYPRKVNSNIVFDVNTSLDDSLVSKVETITSGDVIPRVPSQNQRQVKSVVGGDPSLRDILSVKSSGSGVQPVSAKCLVISCGPCQSARSLFSVLPYTRRIGAMCNRLNHRTHNASGSVSATIDSPHCNGGVSCSATHRSVGNVESHAQQPSASTGTGKPFTNSVASPAMSFTGDFIRNAGLSSQTSFFRPTGDEVISVAMFLRQCRPSFSTPWSTVLKHVHSHGHHDHHNQHQHHHHGCHQCPGTSCPGDFACAAGGNPTPPRLSHLLGFGLSARLSPIGSEEVVCEGLELPCPDQVEACGHDHRTGRANHSLSRHQAAALLPGSANQSRMTGGPLRNRLDSTGKRGGSPSTRSLSSPVSYPDPLLRYLPNLLDDPDLLVATGKRFLQLPGYLATLLTYVRPSEQKRNVNLEFHSRFPSIQLTLTKLRSLKTDIVLTVHKLSFDLWIAAHAHVLFEKLALKLLVNKVNRKAYASAALLISAKLNDIKGPDLSALVQEIENAFRISRRDLLHAEVDAFFNLEFYVIPSDVDIFPHYLRIHRDIDVAPLVPSSCVRRNLLQLRLNSLTDAVISQK